MSAAPESPRPGFSRWRRLAIAVNVVLMAVALVGLLAMVNYLASRYFHRIPLARESRVQLSPLTLNVLRGLTNQVQLYTYFDSSDPLFSAVDDLVKEYARQSPMVQVRQVENLLNPAAALELKSRYNLYDKNVVVFDMEGRLPRKISATELGEFEVAPGAQPNEYRRQLRSFRGEQLFTSAILTLMNPEPVKAYFLQGHGEHAPDRQGSQQGGFSHFAELLKESAITWEKLSLAGDREIPADCKLLILAGPTHPYEPAELEKIHHYLDQGGKALILLNFHSVFRPVGVERILARWGISAGAAVVLDEKGNPLVLVQQFGNHPVVHPLQDLTVQMVRPRTITPIGNKEKDAAAPKVSVLLRSAETSVAGQPDARNQGFNPSDKPASHGLGVAVERGAIPGVSASRGATRLVVLGDSHLFMDQLIETGANLDLARMTVNWLVDRSQSVSGIGPRPVREYSITMTSSQMRKVRWVLLAVIPGAVLLAGVVVWFARRH
jgi:hypothetical protein